MKFPEYRTYRWATDQQKKTGDVRIDNSILNARIRKAVDSQLASQGYEKVDSEPADFLVAYHASVTYRLELTWYIGDYDEGTLILDILDPQTKHLKWRGTAKTAVMFSATPERRERKINQAVRRILERFPPPKSMGENP